MQPSETPEKVTFGAEIRQPLSVRSFVPGNRLELRR